MYFTRMTNLLKGARSGQPGAGGMPSTGKTMGNSAGSAKAAMGFINSDSGLNWEGNHGKGTAKVVGDEIHLKDSHPSMGNAEKATASFEKEWSPGGSHHAWMKEQGVEVEHVKSIAQESSKPSAFAQYETVHKIKVIGRVKKAEYASLFKGAPIGNDNAKGPHAPFRHASTPLTVSAPVTGGGNFSTHSAAMASAQAFIGTKGYAISDGNWQQHVSGKPKPGEGKTNRYSIPLDKGGQETNKFAHIQVYNKGGDSKAPYELNTYVDSGKASIKKWDENKPTLPLTPSVSDDPRACGDLVSGYGSVFKGARSGQPGAGGVSHAAGASSKLVVGSKVKMTSKGWTGMTHEVIGHASNGYVKLRVLSGSKPSNMMKPGSTHAVHESVLETQG